MNRRIAHMALVVRDYDEAIDFYVKKLKFKLIEDTVLDESKRWVLVSPGNDGGSNLLLAKASGDAQEKAIGNQSGGRVFLFLYIDDFKKEFQNLIDNNINIVRQPIDQPYGTVAVFKDLYGNLWDLIEPKNTN